jgi:pantothenate synthetase
MVSTWTNLEHLEVAMNQNNFVASAEERQLAEMLKDVLQRQQAQLKTAKRQLEDAERNAVGHIIGKEGDVVATDDDGSGPPKTLEEDLADMATDNWDDSDS